MYWRMSKAEKELKAVRKGAGYMVIDDEKIFQAVAIETYEHMTWRWRIYLPKGHKYSWKVAYGNVPAEGISSQSAHDSIGETGETILNVALRQNKDNNWSLYLTFRPNNYGEDGSSYAESTSSVPIPDSVMKEMLQKPIGFEYIYIGINGAETRKLDGPIVLLRYRIGQKMLGGGWTGSKNPMPGILVWLETEP